MQALKIAAAASAAVCSLSVAAARDLPTGNEWKEPENLSSGREERRAAFSSFDSLESALKILPEFSERTVCLDSDTEWKFKWSPDPASRPAGFENPAFDVSGWETIKVPCSWQAFGANGKGGWGTALYVNQTYPFKRDQPDVMGEPPKDWTSYAARNPVGSYRRDFEVPEKWNGQEIFLKFDAVDSFFYLWVNGEYVGFSKDSRNPAEFNVTKFVKPGKNTVALEVYRYSDGSYLEDQDMFRLSGIARSTWLLARPKVHIRDFTVTPRPVDRNNLRGDWYLDVTMEPSGAWVPCSAPDFAKVCLFTMDGESVAFAPDKASLVLVDGGGLLHSGWIDHSGGRASFRVKSPKLWSAEEPNCYKLVLNWRGEYVSCLVGFRTSEVRDGRYYFNNEKIKFRGVNRHETDPMFGHYVPRERQEEDVRLMKAANVNHVRNSHYPQDDYFYYLCDIYGIYVLDEANVESHGYYYGAQSLSHRKEWEKATVARNLDMVRRNRNHPSVVFWSLGNEAGPGENFAAASAAVKKMDPSRPIQYERDNSVADVDSNQYPGVDWTRWKANDSKAKKPFYISEYAHNMCNAMGNLKDYQDAIESSDVILGAAIWDWVDQGLYKSAAPQSESPKSEVGSSKSKEQLIIAYGGDFGDRPNDGQFVMNGVILSDRSPEPGYYEVKHVFQPFDIKFSPDGSSATVKNLNYFRSGEGYSLRVAGLDGFKVPLSMPPRGEQTVQVPRRPRGDGSGEKSLATIVEIALDREDGILPAGHVVATEGWLDTAALADRDVFSFEGEVRQVPGDSGDLAFEAGDFSVRFSRETGALVSYVRGGEEHLLAPMTLDAFRSPSSNEVRLGENWAKWGLRDLVQKAVHISPVTSNPDGSKSFTVVADVRGARRERMTGYGGNNGCGAEIVPAGPVSASDPHFSVAQKWTIFAGGQLACQSEIRPRGRSVELARIGYRFTLDKSLERVLWFGAGPFENYPDRKSGAHVSLWRGGSVPGMVENYAKPQDMGNREDTYSVVVARREGAKRAAFGVTTLGGPFSFSAIPYSPTELALAMHPQDLPTSAKTELGIYAAVRGLGGASCGPGPLGRDIVRSSKTFRLDFLIGPPGRRDKWITLPPADLPPDVRTGDDIAPVVVECSSAEPGEGNAEHICDGDISTIWHSQYGVTLTKHPHSVTVDMGRNLKASGFSAWQRPSGRNGNVKNFRFEISTDGKTWKVAAAGTMKPGQGEQKFRFAAPVQMRYWRFTALDEHSGREFASLAEILVEEVK